MSTQHIDKLDGSDSDPDDLFASPSKVSIKAKGRDYGKTTGASGSSALRVADTEYDAEQLREANLKRELEGVRNINEVIEGVISSLETARGNMDSVSRTVTSASTLLNTWTRILSQTEHNQRLILNPNWQGASADIAEMENETVLKAQASQRRAAEEERRREEAKRRAEDEGRERQAGTTVRGARGTRSRGRGRVSARGSSVSGSGYVGVGGQGGIQGTARGSSQTPSRAGSGIGRGIAGARGRARGGVR